MKLSYTNTFLLEYDEGYLLIDTSYLNQYNKFKNNLAQQNISLDEIKYVLLTHHHDDHAGFLKPLIRDTGARLIVHENALPNLEKGVHYMDMEYLNTCTKITLTLFTLIKRHTYPGYTVKDDDIILQGDDENILREIGIDGEILYTPGHTSDSISVVMSNGDAYVGDASMNFLGFCNIKYRPIVYRSLDRVYDDWRLLIEKGVQEVYPSHGEPFHINRLIEVIKHSL